jgi:hypothetical protein
MSRGEHSRKTAKMSASCGHKPLGAGAYLIGSQNPVFKPLEGLRFGQFRPFAR